jgi:hypothetical protein
LQVGFLSVDPDCPKIYLGIISARHRKELQKRELDGLLRTSADAAKATRAGQLALDFAIVLIDVERRFAECCCHELLNHGRFETDDPIAADREEPPVHYVVALSDQPSDHGFGGVVVDGRHQAGVAAARHRRHQPQAITLFDRRLQPLQIADIVLFKKDIYEQVQFAFRRLQALSQRRKRGDQTDRSALHQPRSTAR